MSKLELNTKSKNRQLIKTIGKTVIRQVEKLIAHFSLIGDHNFFENQQFSWIPNVEANWTKVRQELDQLLKYRNALPNFQDISREQYKLTQDDSWKTYFFYLYGRKAEKNCQRCPETTRLIETIPGLTTAFFSILSPHKHIPEHRGDYKGLIRYHLGVLVPQPNNACGIRVGNEIRHWEEGKSLVFDDTFLHEAWNDTDGMRVVLFLDLVRPMPFPFSVINQSIIQLIAWSPFIKESVINQNQWEQRLEEAMKKENLN